MLCEGGVSVSCRPGPTHGCNPHKGLLVDGISVEPQATVHLREGSAAVGDFAAATAELRKDAR